MNEPAPILLFTYKRLDTLKDTVSALQANRYAVDSELFIFSDEGRNDADKSIVEKVRHFINTVSGFKKVTIVEAPENKGLARSIIEGVSQVLDSFDSVIVLEDDLNTTPNFLAFMNGCLSTYERDQNAFSVSGYAFNLGTSTTNDEDAYFINRGWSWGWATWKDRWNQVDWEMKDYTEFINNRAAQRRFAKGGSDLNKMLSEQMSGRLDSWAIRWFYNQFKVNGLTVYPVYSKVFNNGFDQFATHTNGSINRYLPLLDKTHSYTFKLPKQAALNDFYQKAFNKKMGILARIISKVQTILQKVFR